MIKVIVMGRKLNVVDSKNNLVGFDLENDCCAKGGYFISETKQTKDFENCAGIPELDFPKHVFDPDFFESIDDGGYDTGKAVIFKMVPDYEWGEERNINDLYLHLYNVHNGYYSKGFKASFREIRKGKI